MIIPWYYKAIAAVLVVASIYAFGRYQGVQSGKVQQMKDTVQALQNRSDIDAQTKNLPDYDKCIKLGGMSDTCAELRGMDTTTESK